MTKMEWWTTLLSGFAAGVSFCAVIIGTLVLIHGLTP